MFDRVQRAHLTECLNIAEEDVLVQCAAEVGLDVDRWRRDYRSDAVREAVERDRARAALYGVNAVPTLVASGRIVLVGAQPWVRLDAWVRGLLAGGPGRGPGCGGARIPPSAQKNEGEGTAAVRR